MIWYQWKEFILWKLFTNIGNKCPDPTGVWETPPKQEYKGGRRWQALGVTSGQLENRLLPHALGSASLQDTESVPCSFMWFHSLRCFFNISPLPHISFWPPFRTVGYSCPQLAYGLSVLCLLSEYPSASTVHNSSVNYPTVIKPHISAKCSPKCLMGKISLKPDNKAVLLTLPLPRVQILVRNPFHHTDIPAWIESPLGACHWLLAGWWTDCLPQASQRALISSGGAASLLCLWSFLGLLPSAVTMVKRPPQGMWV